MNSMKTNPFPGQDENMKAVVELSSTKGESTLKLAGDPRLIFRLLAEAIVQLGPNIRDGMGDDFEFWKKKTCLMIFEACFGDLNEMLEKTSAEIERLEKEIKAEKGIVIDADAIV